MTRSPYHSSLIVIQTQSASHVGLANCLHTFACSGFKQIYLSRIVAWMFDQSLLWHCLPFWLQLRAPVIFNSVLESTPIVEDQSKLSGSEKWLDLTKVRWNLIFYTAGHIKKNIGESQVEISKCTTGRSFRLIRSGLTLCQFFMPFTNRK